jgi:hypothetical protein
VSGGEQRVTTKLISDTAAIDLDVSRENISNIGVKENITFPITRCCIRFTPVFNSRFLVWPMPDVENVVFQIDIYDIKRSSSRAAFWR